MIGFILGFMGRALIGTLLFSIILFFISLAASLRLLPRLIQGIRWLVRGTLILSYRFYRITFAILQPQIQLHFGVDILRGNARLLMCILFSLTLGALLLFVFDSSMFLWVLGFSLLHGLFVGLAWGDIEHPGGIQLGVDRQ